VLACLGSREASNELIRRYQAQAKRIALKIVRQEELAHEITQEAFLAAYLSLDQLCDPTRFGNWLTSIVRHLALSALKEQQARPISLDQVLEEHPVSEPEGFSLHTIDPQEQAEEHALQELLLATIATLSEKERSAVLLFYYRQHTIQEVATLLEISETAVKSRLFKARRTLRQQLSAEYETVSSRTAGKKGEKHIVAEEQPMYQSNGPLPPRPTQAAMRVLMLAYTEARQHDQPYIGPEHLFLALLHAEIGETAALLAQAGISQESARQAVRAVCPHVAGELARGLSQDARDVLAGSLQLARHFQHEEQEPVHLLLSLLLQGNTLAHHALRQLGIQPGHVLAQALIQLLGAEQARALDLAELRQVIVQKELLPRVAGQQQPMRAARALDTRRESGIIDLDIEKAMRSLQEAQQKLLKKYQAGDPRYERLKQVFESSQRRLALTRRPETPTGRAGISTSYTDVLLYANTIRLRFNHAQHGPEHLLYGILQLTSSQARAAQVLDSLGIERPAIRQALEDFLSEQSYELPGTWLKGGFTDTADEAIEYAYEEAARLGHNFIGAEHLLLGLIRRQKDFSAELLRKAGLDPEKIRRELAQLPLPEL
jgi:RNA polymerase sigma factor (sigma-70 family)